MSALPSGTVSMLFSDIEGSTSLLSRLGASYVDALDGHRRVLRTAWAAHGGTEMGTEGDSFFVVFPTAEGAVRSAALAQRGMDDHPWPAGERVRVRIGIHTGTPLVHDDDYVGMDVHRAARIAAAAHGGQVVLSAASAELVHDDLPDGVRLRDLGNHRLKDIPEPERLFQLMVDGLLNDFPALRTLGAPSSLPSPPTRLVGRDPAVAELVDLFRAGDSRLVTITGAGGAGKTRLAVEAARHLVTDFPDGVYFVPLESVTSSDVMWTTIADELDLPRSARTPARLIERVANRVALFVLDNLEQLDGADEVVMRLLESAPRVCVVASSRRPLGVPGEHLYPLPSLALPADSTLRGAQESAAVQLFVQQARSVRPDFRLTAENVADVVAICERLDGLPLAIELSAARARLLGPKALLRRIDTTLDIASMSRRAPPRHRTLGETIAWSYDLLPVHHQALFRRLGVFAGGADLAAVAAVSSVAGVAHPAAPDDEPADPLDLVSGLADASLVVLTESYDGEPRVRLLETIRTFARRELRDEGELDEARSAHATHFAEVAHRLRVLRDSDHVAALAQAEPELDNFREALTWSLAGGTSTLGASLAGPDIGGAAARAGVALRLASSLSWLWYVGGYVSEGCLWLEQVLDRFQGASSAQLAECFGAYANLLVTRGEPERACELATQGLLMARAAADEAVEAYVLGVLGTAQLHRGDLATARQTLESSLVLQRRIGSRTRLTKALGNLAGVEEELGNYERAEELTLEAIDVVRAAGDVHEAAVQGQNLANLLAVSGRAEEAIRLARSLIDPVLQLRSPNLTMAFANTYMNILVRLGDPVRAAHLLGSEEAMRERLSLPNPFQEEERAEAWSAVEGSIPAEEWEREIAAGRASSVENLLGGLRDG